MDKFWILNEDHETVSVSMREWSIYFNKPDRLLWNTTVGDSKVSTVFLGIDHSFGSGPPLLFETLVMGGPLTDDMERYTTYDQARIGHITMVSQCVAAERHDERNDKT